MRLYTYQGTAKLRVWMSKALGAFLIGGLSLLALFLIWQGIRSPAPDTIVCLALWCLGIGWILGTFFFGAYPDVYVGDNGLTVSFLWAKIYVPWSDVLGVKTRGFPWRNVSLIYARRITPFHMLYSWQYARLLKPGFLVSSSIQGFDELIEIVRRKGSVS